MWYRNFFITIDNNTIFFFIKQFNYFDRVIIISSNLTKIMSEAKLEFINKQVKDMYGASIGKAVGITTDLDGSIENIGVDCGLLGIKQFPYEQLLIQGEYIIHIPRWRLDAQKLLRQKNLALRRIKAIQDIIAENDLLKDDAEIISLKYEKRLRELESTTKDVNEKLEQRLNQLNEEKNNAKIILFDGKLQYKSNEITEDVYQQIQLQINDIFEHINLEVSEINNIKQRLSQQIIENTNMNTNDIPFEANLKQNITDDVQTPEKDSSEEGNTNYVNPQLVSANDNNVSQEKNNENNEQQQENNWLNNVIS